MNGYLRRQSICDWKTPLPPVKAGEHFYEVYARYTVYETRLVAAKTAEEAAKKVNDDYIGVVDGNFDELLEVVDVERLPDFLEFHPTE